MNQRQRALVARCLFLLVFQLTPVPLALWFKFPSPTVNQLGRNNRLNPSSCLNSSLNHPVVVAFATVALSEVPIIGRVVYKENWVRTWSR